MVYVDTMKAKYGRMLMSHLLADTITELHDMADKIGIQRKWFQDAKSAPHYDICQKKVVRALDNGAKLIQCGSPEWATALKKAKERKP